MRKRISMICLVMMMLLLFAACGKQEIEEKVEVIQNGPVDSPEEFIQLGLLLDIGAGDKVTDKTYEIIQNEIASVRFVYGGLDCELRGSSVYSEYELAGFPNTSDGNVVLESVGDCFASIYTLDPGRVVFWEDGQIHYSLYIYVTAEDDIVREILSNVIFENHYTERSDVIQNMDDARAAFAEKIVSVIQGQDTETLSEMLLYPQQLGNGQSAGNARELQALPPESIFTEHLLNAVNTSALSEMRLNQDGSEYIIGANQWNVHFKQMEDGSLIITKINN